MPGFYVYILARDRNGTLYIEAAIEALQAWVPDNGCRRFRDDGGGWGRQTEGRADDGEVTARA